MVIKSLNTGRILDTTGQEITFSLDNPIFADDRMPVAVSTGIEFSLTGLNKEEFGFVDAMMFSPGVQNLPVVIIFEGIEVFSGVLEFDEYSDGTLKYSFVEKSAQDALKGKIYEIQCESYKDMRMNELCESARSGELPDFGLPMIVRKANVAKFEYFTASADPECSAIDKYANWLYTIAPFFIPAVKIDYLLGKILPNVTFPKEASDIIKRLAILGLYKPETWRRERYGAPIICAGFLSWMEEINVAESLPDISNADLIINILKMFCASIFHNGNEYSIRLNKDILSSSDFIDWSGKVAELYSIVVGEEATYTLHYANSETQSFSPSMPDQADEETCMPDSLQICPTYEDMLAKFASTEEYINVKIAGTEHIYSGRSLTANLHPDTVIPIMDMVYQAHMDEIKTTDTDDKGNNYDVTIEFRCPKTIPANVAFTQPFLGGNTLILRGVSPIIEVPAMDSNRSSDTYVGLLMNHNYFDSGNYYSTIIPFQESGKEIANDLSITIGGEKGLYNRFHKDFAEWYIKKKNTVKADIILSPSDVANLRLWQKIMIYNRLFLIKTMELTFSDKTDLVFANAEFIEV